MQLSEDEQASYQRICQILEQRIAAYPSTLAATCRPLLVACWEAEFSQWAALLPTWLNDLIPLTAIQREALGSANLWLMWYAGLFDGILDGSVPTQALPCGQQALLESLEAYRRLGLATTPAWEVLMTQALGAAEAYTQEVATRSEALTQLSSTQLAIWTPSLLMQRAAPFSFSLAAQLYLHGASTSDPRYAPIHTALECLIVARQIADDASDWIDDLRRGHLNSVSARMIAAFWQQRPQQVQRLDVEQLAGFEISAEEVWAELETQQQSYYQRALAALEVLGTCRLQQIICAQQERTQQGWQRLRDRREKLRQMFTISSRATSFIMINPR
ncbi:hypothetical protein OSCT_1339 [Oscillochloris trichoides DG-6]|uniref:Uncharacterized protein n=1 Tax=Oscillochloris trichoides DG-6 TaxID=765420 RepID=E1IDD8_9CHLR|nr:hypothetical protein [Oscillochloris trichoides]EFO80815.1 hypothetical protein OSCT_1339 [Oscillochloris trichoides DG-6]